MDIKQIEKELRLLYPNGHPDFIPMCLEEIKLHSAKSRDFARDGDPLGNFRRVSILLELYDWHIPPHIVALIFKLKQFDAGMNMLLKDYRGEIEDVGERLRDESVYNKLIQILMGK